MGTGSSGMIDLPAMEAPAKRSVSVNGHQTSVTLETTFWKSLETLAKSQGRTRAALIADIDGARPPGVGLATALRLYVLAEVQK